MPVAPHRDLGPHVSLHASHGVDAGKRVALRVVGLMAWEEASRWIALQLDGPLVDKTEWVLHLSIGQQPL